MGRIESARDWESKNGMRGMDEGFRFVADRVDTVPQT